MATLFLICGLPGAGKTTLARQLEATHAALRLCPDEWIAPLLADAANIAELIGLVFFDSGPMALGAGAGLVAVPAWLAWMAAVSVALLVRRTASA